MIDWSKAPEGAQFYSCGNFRKHENGKEYLFDDEWIESEFDPLEWHDKNHDFQIRPIQVGDVYKVVDAVSADLEYNYKYGDCFVVDHKNSNGYFSDGAGTFIEENDILNGYIRLVSTANPKQEESYMYGDMADISKDSPIGNILKNRQKYKATEKYRQKLTIAAVQGLSSNSAYMDNLLEQGLNCASNIAYHASLIADNVIDKEWSEDDE